MVVGETDEGGALGLDDGGEIMAGDIGAEIGFKEYWSGRCCGGRKLCEGDEGAG